jgi:integrase
MKNDRARRHQKGSVWLRGSSFFVRYYAGDGRQRTEFLVAKDDRHHSKTCKPVRDLASQFMARVNGGARDRATPTCSEFWDAEFLPHAEGNLRPSSVKSYKQIWRQHLEAELGAVRLDEYRTHQASAFLTELSRKLGRRTIAHVRGLMSSLFSMAVNLGKAEQNPMRDCRSLAKPKAPAPSPHYSKEEVDAAIAALEGMTDCQLVYALGFYQGLRPSEIAALAWADVEEGWLHVRRGSVRGHVGPTKTGDESRIPLIEPTKSLLEKWRSETAPREYVLESRNGRPADLKNMASRRIRPRLKEKEATWKPLYALRRGAATHLTHLLGNPIAAAQLLRHRNYQVTLTAYVQKDRSALVDGMKKFEAKGAS